MDVKKEVNFYGPALWLGTRTSKRGSSLTSQAALREGRSNECCRVSQCASRGAGRHRHLHQSPQLAVSMGGGDTWGLSFCCRWGETAPCKATGSPLSASNTFSSSWQPHVFPWRSLEQHNWTTTACNRGHFTRSFHFHISIFKCWSFFTELSSALALSILSFLISALLMNPSASYFPWPWAILAVLSSQFLGVWGQKVWSNCGKCQRVRAAASVGDPAILQPHQYWSS